MDRFAERTGLTGDGGVTDQRYLWTDAFAVLTFLALSHALKIESYKALAIRLVDEVHQTLGKFRTDSERAGWISGLPAEEGEKRPTIGGLRIGKKLPERKWDEPYNERLEWERDGQYFHYITRWIKSLLAVAEETGEQKYATWAADLTIAGSKFIYSHRGYLRMYWKMSTDLSRPLVETMGAHDPLEGLICTESVIRQSSERADELESIRQDFRELCASRNWSTTDALGLGGLLLNTARSIKLTELGEVLPDSVTPEKLFNESLRGLKAYSRMHISDRSAGQRLAFRECGLSLGVSVLSEWKEPLKSAELGLNEVASYLPLANDIENFWLDPASREADTWKAHLDINAATLAASLVADEVPTAFY